MVPRQRDPLAPSGRLSRRSVLLAATGVVGAASGCAGLSNAGPARTLTEALDCSDGGPASQWPMGQFDARNTGSVRARAIPDDASATRVDLGARVVAAPVFADGDVVAATMDGVVHVVSSDGTVRGRYDLRAGKVDVPPAVGCGGVFCQTGRSLTALRDLASPTPAWTWPADLGNAGASPQLNLHDGTLLAVTPGALAAVDAATGEVRWRRSNDASERATDSSKRATDRGYWEGAAIDDAVYAIRGEPTSDESDSAVTYDRASVHAFDSNGETVWTRDGIDETRASPVVDGDHVYVVTTGGTVLALRKRTGEVAWRHDLAKGKSVHAPPSVDDDRVYVHDGPGGGRLVALRKRDGEQQWDAWRGNSDIPPVVVGTDVFAVSTQSGPPIARIDADEGTISQTWSVAPTSGFAVGDDVLAVGTSTGLALLG